MWFLIVFTHNRSQVNTHAGWLATNCNNQAEYYSTYLQQHNMPGGQKPPMQQQQQSSSSNGDPWTQGLIRLQYLPPELQGVDSAESLQQHVQQQQQHGSSGSGGGSGTGRSGSVSAPLLHKQKNWNPFIYNDELYFSQVCVLCWRGGGVAGSGWQVCCCCCAAAAAVVYAWY